MTAAFSVPGLWTSRWVPIPTLHDRPRYAFECQRTPAHCRRVRWQLWGLPRLWWREQTELDAVSEYRLADCGLVQEHRVTRMQPLEHSDTNPLWYGPSLLSLGGPGLGPQPSPKPDVEPP